MIEHAKGRGSGNAMVLASASSVVPGEPRITGCTIGNGSALRGIYDSASTAQIINNTISGFSDYGIYLSGSSSALIAGNTITGTGVATAISDYDLDGLLDKGEFIFGTEPKYKDSDGDGFSNMREEISGTDAYNADSTPLVLADGNPLPFGDGRLRQWDLCGRHCRRCI